MKSHKLLLLSIFIAITPIAHAAYLETPIYTVQPVISDNGDVITRSEIYGTVEKKDLSGYSDIRIELTLESEGVQFINFRRQECLPKIYRNKATFKITDFENYNAVEWSAGLHITDPAIQEIRYSATISVNESGVYERVYNSPDILITVAHSNREAKKDSDSDMLTDDEEKILGTDPNNHDTNGNGFLDSVDTDYSDKRDSKDISIYLRGTNTSVEVGEDIILTLLATNLITKPPMKLQTILTVPSGMSVSSVHFVQSGSGQYTATYDVESGVSRFIEIRAKTSQEGSYTIHGKLVYYFGDNKSTARYEELRLPVTVNKKKSIETAVQTNPKQSQSQTVPCFSALGITIGIIAAFMSLRRRS